MAWQPNGGGDGLTPYRDDPVRVLVPIIAVVVAMALGGCGGSDQPAVVGISTFAWPEGPGFVAGTKPGFGSNMPLSVIKSAIPEKLPENPTQTCGYGAKVEVILDDGRTITYGPCNRPASIERLRLALIMAFRRQR